MLKRISVNHSHTTVSHSRCFVLGPVARNRPVYMEKPYHGGGYNGLLALFLAFSDQIVRTLWLSLSFVLLISKMDGRHLSAVPSCSA